LTPVALYPDKQRGQAMSIFGSIMEKIFHAPQADKPAASPEAAVAPPSEVPPSSPGTAAGKIDVADVLTHKASEKGGGGNWQTSIVDLLKLLNLDSSLTARKELASELNVHAGEDGSAEQNIALHKAVMLKLAENGGTVPANFKS
jgi:hypothetical protein